MKTKHFETCSAAICLAEPVNTKETIWYTNEDICKGHAMDKLHRSIRTLQRGYQKRDKKKSRERYFTYEQLKTSAENNLERGRKVAEFQRKHQLTPFSRKRNPKKDK